MPSRRRTDSQLSLFGAPEAAAPPRAAELGPAEVAPHLRATASALPSSIFLGTSSWSFPGWEGLVYDRTATAARLARHGLAAYAQHPLLRAVGIDRTFYAPIPASAFREYAAAVPAAFRFLVKAHELCTLARFPDQERYGKRRGERNPFFFDAAYATAEVIAPCLDGLGAKAGPLLFQLPPQDIAALGGTTGFVEQLQRFLAALPVGPLYAFELRNPQLLTRAYAAVLADAGAAHCINAHPTMPPVALQAERAAAMSPAPLVVRWMLARHFAYEEAKSHYTPFNRIVDDDPQTRAQIASLCNDAARAGRAAFVIINNKAEGSAPCSVFKLAEAICAGRERG